MSAGLAGPSLPPADAGEELRGPLAGVGSLFGDPGCAGDSYPPGGTAGAESGSQAEPSRLQRGAAFGVSPAPLRAGRTRVSPGRDPASPTGNLPQGCPAAGELGMSGRDDQQRGICVLFQTLGMVLQRVGDTEVSPQAPSARCGKGCLGDGQPVRWPRGAGGGS